MSTVKNFLGGGGGESANIFITGLLQSDSVSCTSPSGRSLTPVWGSKVMPVPDQPLVPAMTSATTPSGVASASSQFSSSYAAWKAFDGTNTGSGDCWNNGYRESMPSTIQYQFPSAVIVTDFSIRNRNGTPSYPPKNFKLQASNDGINYVDLGEYTSTDATSNQLTTYSTDNLNAYMYYRLYMTVEWDGVGNGINIGQLQFYGYASQSVQGWQIPCKEYGTYSISATRSGTTISESVLVDVATDYTIDMFF